MSKDRGFLGEGVMNGPGYLWKRVEKNQKEMSFFKKKYGIYESIGQPREHTKPNADQ